MSVVSNVYWLEARGTASMLVFARVSVTTGLPSSRRTTTQPSVTSAGCRCTRRVSREKKPSSGATSPNRVMYRPSQGSRVSAPGLSSFCPVRPMIAGMSVVADSMAITVTAIAAMPTACTNVGSKTSRPRMAIANVVPENSTVRPAWSSAEATAASLVARSRASAPPATDARYSSLKRLTTSSP